MSKQATKTETTEQEGDRVPFPLNFPVVSGATPELSYRRPSGRDMRKAMKGDGTERFDMLLENIFEEKLDVFDRLDGRDYMRLIRMLDGFFDPHPLTSAT